ncbi:MAG: SLBB domain-containing protein [Bacteroidota bacterium]|nr:SLBB domain-containing protein [Bacteroidota bacterium]
MITATTTISVTIGGGFIINGSFPASQYERVDQFITRLFNQSKVQQLNGVTDRTTIELINAQFNSIAMRNIKLKRINGEELILDLEKFHLTGDFRLNPYLKNEDVLIFPKYDIEKDFVSIDGAVNNSLKFQYVEGDKLSDALLFAQGVSGSYQNVTQAEITRLSYTGQAQNPILVNLNSDIALQPGDRIRILADETYRKDFRVLVLGEVNRPGYISIAKDNTSVKDVISKAGGFKNTASLKNAEIIRGNDSYSLYKKNILTKSFEQNKNDNRRMEAILTDNRIMEDLLMERMSYLTEEDTLYFKIDNQLRFFRGNGLVDFTSLDSDTSTAAKFIMKDGDIILVPEKKDLVYIFGQVANAGYVKYNEGKDVYYYIEQAGGLGELARDVEDVSIIKAKSRAWTTIGNKKDVKIEAGDYIWVPKKAPRTFSFYLQRVGVFSSIIGTIATILLLLKQF